MKMSARTRSGCTLASMRTACSPLETVTTSPTAPFRSAVSSFCTFRLSSAMRTLLGTEPPAAATPVVGPDAKRPLGECQADWRRTGRESRRSGEGDELAPEGFFLLGGLFVVVLLGAGVGGRRPRAAAAGLEDRPRGSVFPRPRVVVLLPFLIFGEENGGERVDLFGVLERRRAQPRRRGRSVRLAAEHPEHAAQQPGPPLGLPPDPLP